VGKPTGGDLVRHSEAAADSSAVCFASFVPFRGYSCFSLLGGLAFNPIMSGLDAGQLNGAAH
jgi:hypothetical protein